ncbi:MAG: aminotransferase class V-fold PLP-dependent enzyme [Acidobacteria bacterium]|nr:aminotransferase class V-fold PLP-dependent enzyme [Acidobacteriota bacterium]
MPNRREFLWASQALAILAALNRAHAGTPAQQVASDEDFWREIRRAYLRDPKLINLNNGGVAPSPSLVLEAEIDAIRYSNLLPAQRMWGELEPKIEDTRKRLAALWSADPETIAITRNASESLQIAQFGLDLKPGDEVVTTSQDYPRMITTWQQRERREGIVLRQVDFEVPVRDPGDIVALYERAITPRTRVIHVSQVVFMTGQILPVAEVCALARRHGITSIVDGAHAFAHVPFRFASSADPGQGLDCDFYGASLHKWLSAPIGTGMLYVRRDRVRRHWALMAAPPAMDDNIRKFEEIGTHPAAMHNGIQQALAFHDQMGAERKFARMRYLKQRWAARLTQVKGATLLVGLDPNLSGAFATIQFDGVDPGKLASTLLEKYNIVVVPITGPAMKGKPQFTGIRVSPNVYTSTEEIDTFCEAVEKAVPTLRA